MNAVLFINTHCHFCVESMPFYRQVADLRRAGQPGAALSVLSVEPPDTVKSLLSKEHVAVDNVYRVPQGFELRGTPTLVIVDANGIVQRVFVGQLDSGRQQEVLSIVRAGSV
jgi:thiol-disulfide isomerase/thioredoxin